MRANVPTWMFVDKVNGRLFHAKTQSAQSPQSKSEGYSLGFFAAFACLAPLREPECPLYLQSPNTESTEILSDLCVWLFPDYREHEEEQRASENRPIPFTRSCR